MCGACTHAHMCVHMCVHMYVHICACVFVRFLVCDTPTVADFHAVFAFEWMHKKYSADATISGQNSKKQKVHMYAYVRTVDSIQ